MIEPSLFPTPRLVTIALGTNQGDRPALLAAARTALSEQVGPLVSQSPVVETAPWGVTGQPDYLNQVIVVKWRPPVGSLRDQLLNLLDRTQRIETDLGRVRKERWGTRTCDIDLIFADDLRYEDERLSLPHPWWRARDFVGGVIARELATVGHHDPWLAANTS